MTPEVAQFSNRGMNQDISVSKATNEFAFENYNIRITSVNENTLLSITNEKLPKDLKVHILGKKLTLNKVTVEKVILMSYIVKTKYPVDKGLSVKVEFSNGTSKRISVYRGKTSQSFVAPTGTEVVGYSIASGPSNNYKYYTDTKPDTNREELTEIRGAYLGHAILNNTLVLFTKAGEDDIITTLSLNKDTNTLEGEIRYVGNLNFSLDHPIETLPYYESELVQKVYWVDGLNQPRVINIVADDIIERLDTQFDFNPTVTKFPEVTITKEYQGIGLFPAGVIQYFISYYNKYGAETGIVWASDLNYVTYNDRAGAPDDSIVCSFKIDISNIDTTYDYIRLYSLERTSLNSTPICRIVKDININNSNNIVIRDTNTNTETIDDTLLMFLGGDNFIASTITQKDDVLFLGDLEIKDIVIPQEVLDLFVNVYDNEFKSNIVAFSTKEINTENQTQQPESDIKTFKCGEIYRFALQFQSNTNIWSKPIWIGDKQCNVRPTKDGDITTVATAVVNLTEEQKEVLQKYYTNYRLLIASPTNADRKILAQGIINPTIFNYSHRIKNDGPYAQASWNLRPRNGKVSYEHLSEVGNKVEEDVGGNLVFTNLETCEIQNAINKNPVKYGDIKYSGCLLSLFIVGESYCYNILKVGGSSINDYTSNKTYSDLEELIAEGYAFSIEAVLDEISNKLSKTYDDLNISVQVLEDYFYALKYGQTLPQIENYKQGFISIQNSGDKYSILENYVSNGIRGGGLYTFVMINTELDRSSEYANNYYVDSSIVSFHTPDLEGNESLYDGANLHYVDVGYVPITSTRSELDLYLTNNGLSLNSRELSSLKSDEAFTNRPAFKDFSWNENGEATNTLVDYYIYLWNKKGSIIGQTSDSTKVQSESIGADATALNTTHAVLEKKLSGTSYYSDNTIYTYINSGYNILPSVYSSDNVDTKLFNTLSGKKTYQGNYESISNVSSYKSLDVNLNYYKSFWKTNANTDGYSDKLKQIDPVHIKYKTSPHILFELSNLNYRVCMPKLSTSERFFWDKLQLEYNFEYDATTKYPWIDNSNEDDYSQMDYTDSLNVETPYFIVGEIMRTDFNSDTIYGGTSEDALEKIVWIPASNIYSIDHAIIKSFGDTYYQRWDFLYSYPFTREDVNGSLDTVSFMIETRVNLEGRYDKSKYLSSILNINEATYNKVNPVYSQLNNYFTYNILDEKFNQNKYRNQVTFSLQKTPTSEIDTWCNVNLVSAFNLNGNYGKLNKLSTVNDTIIAFQDRALSVINFNNRTALTTEAGVPIEIANSGKVDGYTVLSSNLGCQNKQSICSTASGVYFIDDLNKTMYGFNKEGLSNISSKGMSMWFKKNLTGKEKLFYDSLTNDVYITNDTKCLVFNEALDSFTSFMDYSNIYGLFNFEGKSILLDTDLSDIKPKMMFDGNYTDNYYIQYKINPEPLTDKTFTNLEFIADKLNDGDIDYTNSKKNIALPFTEFEVWNEYQYGITNITKGRKYPNFERKFRVWRVDIPRDKSNGRDRIRNPWIYLKLSNKDKNDAKMVFHNLLVKYYK